MRQPLKQIYYMSSKDLGDLRLRVNHNINHGGTRLVSLFKDGKFYYAVLEEELEDGEELDERK